MKSNFCKCDYIDNICLCLESDIDFIKFLLKELRKSDDIFVIDILKSHLVHTINLYNYLNELSTDRSKNNGN